MKNNIKQILIILDQSIVSLGNFLITLMLIKFLGLREFGIFSFFWIFLLLIQSTQLAFIISPMLSNIPKQSDSNIKYFYGSVFLQQIFLCLVMFFFVLIFLKYFFSIFFSYDIKNLYLPFSLIILSSQLFQFCRRLLISLGNIILLIIVDFVVYFILIISIYIFKQYYYLNVEVIFWQFFIIFFIGSLLLYKTIFYLNFSIVNFFLSIKDNWKIGKWLLLTSLAQWFSGNLWVINAGIILGPYYLGVIRACQTIIGILNPILQSFENIFPHDVSKILKEKNKYHMNKYLNKNIIKVFSILLIISLAIILFSKQILLTFYGSEISNYNYLLSYLVLVFPFISLQVFPQYGLRSISKTFPIFLSYLTSSAFTILTSSYLINEFGLNGFICGVYLSSLLTLLVTYCSFYYYLKKY